MLGKFLDLFPGPFALRDEESVGVADQISNAIGFDRVEVAAK